MIQEGKSGIGFAVGQEPLSAVFVKNGCKILATDLEIEQAREKGWIDSHEHAAGLTLLNKKNICDNNLFQNQCRFRNVDMNQIPEDLRGFDFLWSSCALEHLGSIKNGKNFIHNSLKCLKPRGIAVHTTEYNLTSNYFTFDTFPKTFKNCLFRKRDLEDVAKKLDAEGHEIRLSFQLGNTPEDQYVDVPPYKMNPHIKLRIGSRFNPLVCTSYGIVIRKA